MRGNCWYRTLALSAIIFLPAISAQALMKQTTSKPDAGTFCQGFSQYGIPDHKVQSDMYLCRDGYMVGYNFKTKEANWAIYRLTGKSVSKRLKRHDDFEPDLTIPKPYRAELSDYSRSGYDRGHLAPYASMDFSKESAQQSFLLSNMAPQKPGLNRQGWARLESDVRFWARSKGEVYVVTGVIFKKQRAHKFIGKNKIAVPDYFYKIVYAPNQDQAIAFVMPNARVKKNQVAKYRDSIADIESRTGMRFFTELPEQQRDALSAGVSDMWRTHY